MRKIANVTILLASSLVILASSITIMIIALTRYADVPYLSLIFASGSHWPTLISGTVGATVAYFLVTRNEKRKEAAFERRVKDAIRHELNQYYEVLKQALLADKLRTDRNNTLELDQNSEVAAKFGSLNLQNPIYTQIGIDTKIKTLDGSLINRLDLLYRETTTIGLHMGIQDTGKEVYFAVSKNGAENLKEAISVAIDLLN